MELLNSGNKFYDRIEITIRDYKKLEATQRVNKWLAEKGFSWYQIRGIRIWFDIHRMTAILFC